MGSKRLWMLGAILVAVLMVLPGASALNIATKSIQARPSAEYSPHTAWEAGYHGCGVTVAVFDEGVDDGHPYLDGKVIAGYDSTASNPMWTQANGGNPQPVVGSHGTPVAGIAVSHAGQMFTSNDQAPEYADEDLVGVAPCAWMVDVMFSDVPNAGETPATDDFTSNVIQAIDWAIEHKNASWGDEDPSNDGIDIITMSWSPNDKTDGTDPICQAATKAVQNGIVVLGSAGNSGSMEEPDLGCPTGADGAISVANLFNQRTVDRGDDELRDSSTWGPRTDDGDDDPYEELKPTIAAPGHNVVSTGASLADGSEYEYVCFGADEPTALPAAPPVSTGYECESSFGGTSAATPMTAGVVALMLDANPDLSPQGVQSILEQTGELHPEMNQSAANLSATWDHRYGYGMIDAYEAVKMAETWPGVERGIDRDTDGVRDFIDAEPTNPDVRDLVQPANVSTNSSAIDSDGDGVADAEDGAPLNPFSNRSTNTSTSTGNDAPGVGILVAVLVLAGLAQVRRRR